MQSAQLRDTLRQALTGTAEAFDSLSQHVVRSGTHLRSGEIQEGNELLSRILGDLSSLSGFLEDAGRLREFTEGVGHERLRNLERQSRRTTETLNSAMSAQESQDWVYLADILEYELSPLMISWQDLLAELAGKMSSN